MPSSVNPHAPASFNASMSTSSRPFNEREIAAAWKIRIFSLEARERLSLRTGTESTVGEVFAMQIAELHDAAAVKARRQLSRCECRLVGLDAAVAPVEVNAEQHDQNEQVAPEMMFFSLSRHGNSNL